MFSLIQSLTRRGDDDDDDLPPPLPQTEGNNRDDDAIVIPPQQEQQLLGNDKTTTTITKPSTPTWKDVHEAYCQKHHVLRASIQQVLDDDANSNNNRNNDDNYTIPWELPTRQTVVTTPEECLPYLSTIPTQAPEAKMTTTTKTSSRTATAVAAASTIWNVTKRLGTSLASKVLSPDDEDGFFDDDNVVKNDWRPLDDDAHDETTTTDMKVDWNIPLIHVERTRNACQILVREATQEIILQENTQQPPFLILPQRDWMYWCQRHVADGIGLSNDNEEDYQLLLNLLILQQRAQIVSRPNNNNDNSSPSLIVLMNQNVGHNNQEQQQQSLQVHVALWDLRHAQQKWEHSIASWSEQVTKCQQQALKWKRQNNKNMALMELQKAKKYQQQMDTASQTLFNLHQMEMTLETSHAQTHHLLPLLKQSTALLSQLNAQASSEVVDDIQLDWQDAMTTTQDVAHALTTSTTTTTTTSTEEDDMELLQELEQLTIQDHDDDHHDDDGNNNNNNNKGKKESTDDKEPLSFPLPPHESPTPPDAKTTTTTTPTVIPQT